MFVDIRREKIIKIEKKTGKEILAIICLMFVMLCCTTVRILLDAVILFGLHNAILILLRERNTL